MNRLSFTQSSPDIARGRESHTMLNALSTLSDKMLYASGRSFHFVYKQLHSIKTNSTQGTLRHRAIGIITAPVVGVSSLVCTAVGILGLLGSVFIRSPLTIAEKTHRIPLFTLTARSQKAPPSIRKKEEFSVMSLNIMGLPDIICDYNKMNPCGDRIQGIVDCIKEKNPDVVCLEECFLDVYAQRILKSLPPEYQYMVSKVQGGGLTSPLGSGLVIISKYPIKKVEVRQYRNLLKEEKFSQKGVVAALIDYNGKDICLGASHLQAAGLRQPIVAQEQLLIMQKTVDELAKTSNQVALKVMVGDMNLDPVKGIYREVTKKEASHVLVENTDTKEQRLLVQGEPFSPVWKPLRYLHVEPYAGIRLSNKGYQVSEALPRQNPLFSHQEGNWTPVFPEGETSVTTALQKGDHRVGDLYRGTEAPSKISILSSNASPIAKIVDTALEQSLTIYKQDDIENVRVDGQKMIDWCFVQCPRGKENIEAKTSIMKQTPSHTQWIETVSDHFAIISSFKNI